MTVTLKALRYFLHAVDRRSIAAAASDLSVAPSAVAAAIDSIETTLDLTLVHRQRAKGLEPTTSGLAIAARARLLIEDHENLLSLGVELRGALSGSLRIGYYAPVAPAFLPTILAPILKANPALQANFVDCDTERARQGLVSGEFDAILMLDAAPDPAVEVMPLVTAPPYLLVRPDDRLAGRRIADVKALADRSVVLLDLPVVRGYYERVFDHAGITPHIAATADTHEMVRSLVGQGVGCAVLNMIPRTDRTYADDTVKAVPLTTGVDPIVLALGVMRGRRRRVVDVFADACIRYFAAPDAHALVIGAIKPPTA